MAIKNLCTGWYRCSGQNIIAQKLKSSSNILVCNKYMDQKRGYVLEAVTKLDKIHY